MKLFDFYSTTNSILEMSRTAVPCPNCGQPKSTVWHFYANGRRCKTKAIEAGRAQGLNPNPKFVDRSDNFTASPASPASPIQQSTSINQSTTQQHTRSTVGQQSTIPVVPIQSKAEIIEKWLITQQITGYTIQPDLTINVDGNADIGLNGTLDEGYLMLPYKFGKVTGMFNVAGGALESLKNCPDWVGGDFGAHHNDLKSFVDSPRIVLGNGLFGFNVDVTSLEGLPGEIGRDLDLRGLTEITSLAGIDDIVQRVGRKIYLDGTPITSHAIAILLIDGVKDVAFDAQFPREAAEIISKSLKERDPNTGLVDVHDCQHKLRIAGFKELARIG